MWDPNNHSDDENLRWSWLRAVEWGSWPTFVSQPIVPIVFLFFRWWSVLVVITAANLLWKAFVTYRVVSVDLAFLGEHFARLKWIASILACYLLWRNGAKGTALLALFWPFLAGFVPPISAQIGVIQQMFMQRLGYESTRPQATP